MGKSSTTAQNRYIKKAYDRVNLVLRKDTEPTKEQVQAAADAANESLNAYIVQAIAERIQRDNMPASKEE